MDGQLVALIIRSEGGIFLYLILQMYRVKVGMSCFMGLAETCLPGSGWVNCQRSHGQPSVGGWGVAMW